MNSINLNEINLAGSTQLREELTKSAIADYREAMEDGVEFPPVELMHDGLDYWVVDGFHRILAANQIGLVDIKANVSKGTQRDAVLSACHANSVHGVPRTNEDKKKAVLTLLNDEEWSTWSDRAIAEACSVSNKMVSNYRNQLCTVHSSPKKTVGKDGKERKRPEPKPIINTEPDTSNETPKPFTVSDPKINQDTRIAPEPEEEKRRRRLFPGRLSTRTGSGDSGGD